MLTASTRLEWPCVDRFTPDPLETVDADTEVSAIYDQWVSVTHRSTRIYRSHQVAAAEV